MGEPTIPLESLLPEIYPIIAKHLPLYATASSLLSLALTNHRISAITLPIIHSRLVLKTEKDAISILQKLADDLSFGREVRELHIMTNLSAETRESNPPLDVVRRLQDVILKGHLPFINTLNLNLMKGWYFDGSPQYHPIQGFGELRKEFWLDLREKCPRLRSLALQGFADNIDQPWIEDSGCLDMPDLTSIKLHFLDFSLKQSAFTKLTRHISTLAPSLHTLDLQMFGEEATSPSSVLTLEFPCLRSLSFAFFSNLDAELSMAFFARHPSIEYLNLAYNLIEDNPKGSWFTPELPSNFLPHLRHLRARWIDARRLAPILHQLIVLSIHDSVNAQIPYLFREVLPNGLSNLRSLSIAQWPFQSTKANAPEGSFWYEDEDGTFHQAKEKDPGRTVFQNYMHSIVRAAPNVEEIGFLSLFPLPEAVHDLNNLSNLKRLYHKNWYDSFETIPAEDRETFTDETATLIRAVPGLESITNVDTPYLPYLTARTKRDDNGDVVSVEVGKGVGMTIDYDDEAFPWAPGQK
ncbi:hypothetical protein CPB83DRAFT_761386 [Crepidotus variabilis]|uniref:Uncharacterized protein n=1 Tax=Crepidotus variabilis TaxID=179855 RepID=A0A9P6EM52_9AGAR|nr:hypothetical protein CPB83DRAFT_761386 [Crepidotus variabilis]